MRGWFRSKVRATLAKTVAGTIAGTATLLVPAVCQAALIDPSTLHIGTGINTNCEQGCAGDPNLISGNVLDIFQQSGGAPGLNSPLLLIIGIANNAGKFFSDTSGITATTTNGSTTTVDSVAFAAKGTDGITKGGTSGFFGNMTSGQEAYSFLGLGGANNSNSFTNWADEDAESPPGVTATTFGIYAFAITENPSNMMQGGGLINITFSNADTLPLGSYAIAYGIDSTNSSKVYDTPFTEAGLTTTPGTIQTQSAVPEPASLALLGSGLLYIGMRFRRKRTAKPKA